ncbi:MAG: hypothetical protein GC159_02860 [Phycisphaera sp.]|nr:hypothetical protein [Phycisphaera sp.]
MTRSTQKTRQTHTAHSTLFDTGRDRCGVVDTRRPRRVGQPRARRFMRIAEPTAYLRWCMIGSVIAAVTVAARAIWMFVRVLVRGRLAG